MASIERTAYPRFKRLPTAKELREIYTPTSQEIEFSYQAARGAQNRLTLLALLKAFQRLGYFPSLDQIPQPIILHIATCLRVPENVTVGYDNLRTLYRHHRTIREYLEVIPYGKHARHVAIEAVFKATHVQDNPADLINVAIAELIKERCELPAFSTLDRLVRRVRTLVNFRFFRSVLERLPVEEQRRLDRLLDTNEPTHRSDFNYLKEPPKSATLTHMQNLQARFSWLLTMGDVERLLQDIPNAKIKHFAAEARALDASELRRFTPPKRYTLLVSMLHRAKITARDNLVETFLKRMGAIHNKGKQALEELREKHRTKTERLISVLSEVLETAESAQDDDATLGRQVKELLAAQGGTVTLKAYYERVRVLQR